MSDPESLVSAVLDALRTRGETVATAESITAGGVCAALTSVSGASDVVRGGVIVYATDLKIGLAGVPRALIDARGAVDPEVALALAEGARKRCEADWGLGLTGVAGPGPSDGIEAGTVHIGLAGPGVRTTTPARLAGDRDQVRADAVRLALRVLAEHLDPAGR
ncbi:MAG: nicotinamide-nucleotide amidohydrolase family protein [Actinophytocola sp.]|nr:nicotinamide-nucleotide amidohydrolase family protein [Actinophytocola sp.]